MNLQITGPSLDEIREALDLPGELRSGSSLPLGEGATITIDEVSKSSGFDATTVIVMAVVTIATSTTSALLVEWLKTRLFKSGSKSSITIVADGKEIVVR